MPDCVGTAYNRATLRHKLLIAATPGTSSRRFAAVKLCVGELTRPSLQIDAEAEIARFA
jgi:hypothetical protein